MLVFAEQVPLGNASLLLSLVFIYVITSESRQALIQTKIIFPPCSLLLAFLASLLPSSFKWVRG
nr:hypothetical protein Q903MT_gene1144 [Picea sitchensis]